MAEMTKKSDKIALFFTFIHFAQAKFDSLGIHCLNNLPYNSDISLCDFWLFKYIKMKLEAMSFATPSVLVYEVQEILDMIYIIEYVKIFDEWKV
jgi:hypothetical protein